MKFGFITTVLKNLGKTVLPLAEDAGIAAANAALPGIGGTLAQLAITGITNAVLKHGTAPSSAPSPADPTITVGQAKKFDVMQLLEANAPEIMNAILAGRGKAVVDRAAFVEGTDKIVEGFLEIMKAVGAVPSSNPPVDPVVITPAVVAATQANPAPAPLAPPTTNVFKATVSNLEAPKSVDPLEIAAMLAQVVAKLQGK